MSMSTTMSVLTALTVSITPTPSFKPTLDRIDLNCTDDLVCTDPPLCMDTLIRIRLVRIDTLALIDNHVRINGNNAFGLIDAFVRPDARSH